MEEDKDNVFTPQEEKDKRKAICAACDKNTTKVTCDMCGCNLETMAVYIFKSCPIGKW